MFNNKLDDLTPTQPFFLVAAGVCVWAGYKLSRYGQRESYLPPGPPTKPLIGNIDVLPKKANQYQFTEWANQYGEIFSLKLAHQTMIVLSSHEAIHHIMEKNSAVSSDRPPFHIKDRVEGQDNNLAGARYGDRWRSLRRAAQQVLSSHACRRHLAVQQAESTQLMYEMLTDPMGVRIHLRRASTSVINSVMFGVRFPRPTTPLYREFWEMLEMSLKINSSTEQPPIDLFPILKYIPERWAKWKTRCRDFKVIHVSVLRKMLKPVEDRLARGVENGAFMEEVYMRAKEWNLDQEAVQALGYIMMVAGAETTSTFLQIFILCLATHPEVLRKLHEEMDRVVGTDRTPEFDDFDNLPYLQAVVSETHRFRPVIPLGLPHANIEDIGYKQYVIPKGSIIFQNSWALFRDPNLFKDPETFNPERFIENPELHKYPDYAFGSGRRACVGIHLAHSSLKINTMNLIWFFSISKALDSEGHMVEPNLHFAKAGIVQGPDEVRVSIKPRTPHHEEVLRQSFRDSAEAFRPFEFDLDEEEKRYAEELRHAA